LAVAKKEIDTIKSSLEAEKKKNEQAKTDKTKLENEIQKLTYIIKEAHEEHEKLKKDY
jgi:chromosome segregation ATPase